MMTLLKNPVFLRFWLGQVIAQLGDGITRVAITYLVATLSKDPMAIGLVIFAQLLPSAVFGLFMGPLADKFNRRWLMLSADLYRMMIVLLMIPFHDSVAVLIFLIALQGLGAALFDPARSASIPELVGEKHIHSAVSLSQSTRAAMDIIGPSLGALLLISEHYNMIFTINAITYFLSAVFIFTLTSIGKNRSKSKQNQESYLSSIKTGVVQVTGMPALRFLLILLMPITLVIGILNTNLVAVLTHTFNVSAFHFGFIEASLAIGVIIGAAGLGPVFLKKSKPNTVLLTGTAAIGAWMVLIIPLDSLQQQFGIVPVYVWCIMVGVLNAFINVPLSSLFLTVTPAEFRGRGSSLLGFTANFSMIIGILCGGVVAGNMGVLYGTAFAGALLVAVAFFLPLLKGYKSLSGGGNTENKATSQTAAAN